MTESVQKRFTRRIPRFYNARVPYGRRLHFLVLDSLEMRMLKLALGQSYKIVNGFYDFDFHALFHFSQNPHYSRSHGLQIEMQNCRTDRGRWFFAIRVAKLWNALPQEVVTSQNLRCL